MAGARLPALARPGTYCRRPSHKRAGLDSGYGMNPANLTRPGLSMGLRVQRVLPRRRLCDGPVCPGCRLRVPMSPALAAAVSFAW